MFFSQISQSFDGATTDVNLTVADVTAVTKSVANDLYAENPVALVSVKNNAEATAQSAVDAAESTQATIEAGTPAEAEAGLNAGITLVNTSIAADINTSTAASVDAADDLNTTALQAIVDAQAEQEAKEAEIAAAVAAAKAAAEAEAQAAADYAAALAAADLEAQKAAYDALLEAQAEELRKAEAQRAAEAAAVEAAALAAAQEAQLAADQAAKDAAAAVAAAELQAAQEKAAAEAAEAAARIAAAEAAAAEAAAAADLAAAQIAAANSERNAAVNIMKIQAESLVVNAYGYVATVTASRDSIVFIQSLDVNYSIDPDITDALSRANDALVDVEMFSSETNSSAQDLYDFASLVAAEANVTDANVSDANVTLQLVITNKNDAHTQVAIAQTALDDARAAVLVIQAEKAEAQAAAAAEAEKQRVVGLVQAALTAANDNNVSNDLSTIDSAIALAYTDLNATLAIADEYPTLAFATVAAQTAYDRALVAQTEAQIAAADLNSSVTIIEAELLKAQDANTTEVLAQEELAKALVATGIVTARTTEVAGIKVGLAEALADSQEIRDLEIARLAGEEALRIALAIQASKDTAQGFLNTAINEANDANASAILALQNATDAGEEALTNANAVVYAQAAAGFAQTAGTQATESGIAAELAGVEITRVFVTDVADINESAASEAADLIESFKESAVAAAALAKTAQVNAALQLQLAQDATPPVIVDGGFVEGMTINWIDEDNDEIRVGQVALAVGNELTETQEILDIDSKSFIPDTNSYENLVLQDDGSWAVEDSTTYTLLNGVVSLSNGEDVRIETTLDLDNPIGPVAVVIAEINKLIPGDENLTFSADAKAYQLAFKGTESYNLSYIPTFCSEWGVANNCIGTETPYSSLEEYMASYNSPAGIENAFGEWVAIDFERDIDAMASEYHEKPVIDSTGAEVTTLVNGQTGNLVIFDTASPSGDQDLVGTWEVVTLPNAQLAIMMAPLNGYEEYFDDNLIAVANSVVQKGEHKLATTTFVAQDDELKFNEIAIADIKAAIIRYVELAPTTGPIAAILAEGNGVWGEYSYGGNNYDQLVACYVYSDNGTFTYTEGEQTWTIGLSESENTLNWVDENGTNVGPEITVSEGYNSSLMSLFMLWSDDSDNREWHKMDSCNIGGTSTSEFELDIERVTLSNTAMTWQQLVDINGTYVDDVTEEADENNISFNPDNTINISGEATLKYLGEVIGSDFNSSIFSSSVSVYQVAYIRSVEELDSWGNIVYDDNGSQISTLEGVIAYYNGADGYVMYDKGLPEGYALAFYMNEVVVVDSSGLIIEAYNGVYTHLIEPGADDKGPYRVLKILNATQDWNSAYIERSGVIERGDWAAVGGGGIFTLYGEDAKTEFITWFNENNITQKLRFDESKVNWEAEFNLLPAIAPSALVALSPLYSIDIDEDYEEATPMIDFSGLVGKTIYFATDSGYFGMRTFLPGGLTTGILSWAGEYTGTYTTYDNVVEIDVNGTKTYLALDEQPVFDNMIDVPVKLNGEPVATSTWNSTEALPVELLDVDISYLNANGGTGVRRFNAQGIAYLNGMAIGGYIYSSNTNMLAIISPTTRVDISLMLPELANMPASVTNAEGTVGTTTTWTVGAFPYEAFFSETKYFVTENGIQGFRTYDSNDSSYIGLVGDTTVQGGFSMLNGIMTHTRNLPSPLGMTFTHVGKTYFGDGEMFHLSIDNGTPFETYIYNTEAERDAAFLEATAP